MARPRRLAPRNPDDPLVLVRHPKGWAKQVRRSQLDRLLSSNWTLVEPEQPKPAKTTKTKEPVTPTEKE